MPALSFPPLPTITLGPFTFYTWGLFVALGILVATIVAARRARRAGIPTGMIWDGAFWISFAGLVGARLLYVLEYWRDFVGEPWRALAFWQGGMSAFGALTAGILAGFWFVRRYRLAPRTLAAAAAPAALLGDAIGRFGGALSHMYPGVPTTFPISYVLDGVQRHEVGIELMLASLIGFLVILGVERICETRRKGSRHEAVGSGDAVTQVPTAYCPLPIAQLVLLWYSLERFLLDFLRSTDLPGSDLRYVGLTLAQLCALVGASMAIWFVWRARRPHFAPIGASHSVP